MNKLSKDNTPNYVFFSQTLRKRIQSAIQQLREKYLVFLFFVFLSALGWFFLVLTEVSTANIKYPVKYTGLPPNKILSQAPPNQLTLSVRADGFTILANKLKLKRPLSYNVNAFKLYSLSLDSLSVYTLTRYALDSLTYELKRKNKNFEILNIAPDTLTFNFASVKKKKVPIAVRIKYNPDLFMRQHMFNGQPVCFPDSIEVTGPASIIDTLRYVYTSPLNLRNLSDSVQKRANLRGISRVEMRERRVKVMIPVDEFTEAELVIPLKQRAVPDSLILKTFPVTIRVKYHVTMSNYDRVAPDIFEAYVDFDKLVIGESSKMQVETEPAPIYLHNIKYSHKYVEYLIEKKSVEVRSDRRNR